MRDMKTSSLRVTAMSAAALVGCVSLAACGGSTSGADGSDSVTLKVVSYQPSTSATSVVMQDVAKDITDKTDGSVKFKFYWSGSLIPAEQIASGVSTGQADIGYTAAEYEPSELPLSLIDGIPFMTPNVEAAGRAFSDLYQTSAALQKEYSSHGLRLLDAAPPGEAVILSNSPLSSPDDLKGKSIRMVGLGALAMKAAGANPVAMPVTDTYQALQRKVVDGVSSVSLEIGIDQGLQSVAKYVTDPNFGAFIFGLEVMNAKTYQKLSASQRNVFDEEFGKFQTRYYDELTKVQDADCAKYADAGVKLSTWSDDATQAWKSEVGDVAVDSWLSTAKKSDADAAALLDKYRSLIAKHEKTASYTPAVARCASK